MDKSNLAVKEEEIAINNEPALNEIVSDTIVETGKIIEIEQPKENKKPAIKRVGILYLVCKEVVDILAGIVGTLLLIPITLLVYLMRIIKHENDGPIFYTQLRIGKKEKNSNYINLGQW